MLGNPARFAGGDFGGADVVQQRGFTVVNVTHDGHDRRTTFLRSIGITIVHYRFFQLVLAAQDHFVTHLFGHQLGGFLIDNLVDGRHGTHLHHRFNNQRAFHRHFVGQFGNGDGFANDDVTVHRLSRFVEALLQRAWFTMFATFTAAYLSTRFFTVSFGFRVLVAFFGRTRCLGGAGATTTTFDFAIVFVFCLTGMS